METENIPLFPLGLVAFPGEKLNLHIFESRYRQLIHECWDEEKTFGIPPFRQGMDIMLGTEMEVLEITKLHDDGKMDIKTLGRRVFKIEEFYSKASGKLYPSGEVIFMPDEESSASIMAFNAVMQLVEELYRLMKIETPLPAWDDDFTIYEIAHKLGMNFSQEMTLLKIRSEADRLAYVKDHLEKLIPIVTQMEELKSRVKMNGHFKNVIPPHIP